MSTGFWWKIKRKDTLGKLDEDERKILKWILERWDGRYGMDSSGSETSGGVL
jgi:hypothetical protein